MKKTKCRYDQYEITPKDREILSYVICPGTIKTLMGIDVEDHPTVLDKKCNTLLSLSDIDKVNRSTPTHPFRFEVVCQKCGHSWHVKFSILMEAASSLERLHSQGYED